MLPEQLPQLNLLVELAVQDELAIFIGPDGPQQLTGAPSWLDLAERLAARGGFDGPPDWPLVAARYEQANGRNNLIRWLRRQFAELRVGAFYRQLARLRVSHYISATYDALLEDALDEVGREANIVVENPDLNFIDPGLPTVVKVLGQATSGRYDSLLLTAGELQRLARNRAEILDQEIYPQLTRRSLLIFGQDLSSEFFRTLYYQSPAANDMRRRAYCVLPHLEPWQREMWADEHLTIIDHDPLTLLQHLPMAKSDRPEEEAAEVETPPATRPEPPVDQQTSGTYDRTQLRLLLRDHFSTEELNTLAFDLGVNQDELAGTSISVRARELVRYMYRRDRLAELVEMARRERPDAPWHLVSG